MRIDIKSDMKIHNRIGPLNPPKPDSHYLNEFLTRAGVSIRPCIVRLNRLPVSKLPKDKPEGGQQTLEAVDKFDIFTDFTPVLGSPLQIPARFDMNRQPFFYFEINLKYTSTLWFQIEHKYTWCEKKLLYGWKENNQ